MTGGTATSPGSTHRRWLRRALAGLALSASIGACGLADESTSPITSTAELAAATPASGSVTIDGMAYIFQPSTCSIADGDFVAAGSGRTIDGQPFFVRVEAPDRVSLALGVNSGDQQPNDPDNVFQAFAGPMFDVRGATISGETTLTQAASQTDHRARVMVTCDIAGDGPSS